ncbi:MAG TPA: hypothetical protein VIM65_18245 [Cyclobacteriaceae bacterium]
MTSRFNEAFEFGYYKATKLLMDITGEEVYYNNFHYGLHEIGSQKTKRLDSLNGNISNILVASTISVEERGSLGKSHLILSNRDVNILSSIAKNGKIQTDRSYDFAIDLNNILTSSIVETMNEELNLAAFQSDTAVEDYFDGDMSKVIQAGSGENTDLIYTNAIFFSFKKYPDLRPCLVWVLNGNLFL